MIYKSNNTKTLHQKKAWGKPCINEMDVKRVTRQQGPGPLGSKTSVNVEDDAAKESS
ncbi:MAG: hypothetical protein R6U19_05005 [Bacteroidales bacterium]